MLWKQLLRYRKERRVFGYLGILENLKKAVFNDGEEPRYIYSAPLLSQITCLCLPYYHTVPSL